MANQWQVKRLAGALGAEITGIDLTAATDIDIEHVKELLLEHKVVFFHVLQNLRFVWLSHTFQCSAYAHPIGI